MRVETCPSEEQLQAFQLGQLPQPALDEVADHLERCAQCETVARRLDATLDPLLAAIRHTSVASLGQTRSSVPQDPTPLPRRAPGPSLTYYPFLLPPVEPDEIGRLGNYRVLRLLGKGGMAFVFHAEDIALRRPVALKVMKPDLHADADGWRRFLREARIMAAIKHAHLATVYQAGQEGGAVYLAMELLAGESLGAFIDRRPPVEVGEIIRLAREIASGLAVIHGAGLVHRDIKPDNIWLEAPGGAVKILDFGLARFVHEDSRLTQPGTMMGTPAFMAPEQARGETVDGRTDLYSLGAILYYLCTGRRPFESDNTMILLTALALETPRPVHELKPSVPRPLSDLIGALLAKSPADRPTSAQAVIEQLAQIDKWLALPPASRPALAVEPAPATAPSQAAPARFMSRRWGVFTLVLGIVTSFGLLTAGIRAFLANRPAVVPRPSGAAAYPTVEGAVYLRDLDFMEPVNFPFPGRLPGDPPPVEEPADWPAPLGGHRVSVAGKFSPRGIWMHLSPGDPQKRTGVSYRLDKQYQTFTTEVSLNDGPRECIPLTFTVYGDGKVLWQSNPLSSQNDTQKCANLGVRDVTKLTLEVTGTGDEKATHAVWIEPYLAK